MTELKTLDRITYTDMDLAQLHAHLTENKLTKNQWMANEGAITLNEDGSIKAVIVHVTEYKGRSISKCLPAKYLELQNKWSQYCSYCERKNYGIAKRLEQIQNEFPEANIKSVDVTMEKKVPDAIAKISKKKK